MATEPSPELSLHALIAEMRTIAIVAGQCSVEGPEDAKSLMAAAEADRASRWADDLEAALVSISPQQASFSVHSQEQANFEQIPASAALQDVRALLEAAFDAGHFAWPTVETPTRAALRSAAVDDILSRAALVSRAPQPEHE